MTASTAAADGNRQASKPWARGERRAARRPPCPLLWAALAAAAGVATAEGIGPGWQWVWLPAVLIVTALALVAAMSRVVTLVLLAFTGFGALHDARLGAVPDHIPGGAGLRTLTGTMDGVVATGPPAGLAGRPLPARGVLVVRPDDRQPPARSADGRGADQAGGLGDPSRARAWRIEVQFPDGVGPLPRDGDLVLVRGWLAPASPPRNPGEFDAERHFQRSGLAGRMRLRESGEFRVLAGNGGPTWLERALAARAWLRSSLTAGLEDSPEIASVLASMVLGAQEDTPAEIEEAFRRSGTLHLFAISGLHVGIFSLLLWSLAKLLRIPRQWAIFLIIPLVFAYAFVTGWRPSAVRAAVMVSLVLLGLLLGRGVRPANTLGAAAIVVLAFDTHQLFLPGFQLSFVVLGSILVLGSAFAAPLLRLASHDPFLPQSLLTGRQRAWHATLRYGAAIVAVSAAAWIGSAPLTWMHFGTLAPIGIVANLFLMPAAHAILAIAVLSIACSAVGLTVPAILANNANWLLAKSVLAMAAFFAGIPGGNFEGAGGGVRSGVGAGSPVATVLDIPSGGGCQIILLGDRSAWMIDAGDAAAAEGTVRRFLMRHGVERLDGLLITHWDAGHSGGAASIIREFRPERITLPPVRSTSPSMAATLDAIAEAGLGPPAFARSGATVFQRSGTRLDVIHAPSEGARGVADDLCVVVRLQHGGRSILFQSDAGFGTERALLDGGGDLRADIVVAGRHTSDPGLTSAFLRAVSPSALVATHAGFPAGERLPDRVQGTLDDQGIAVFRQDACGAVTITIEAGDSEPATVHLEATAREAPRRRWRIGG